MDRLKNPSLWLVFVISVLGVVAHTAGLTANIQKWMLTVSSVLGIFGGLFFPAMFPVNPPISEKLPLPPSGK